MKFIDIKEKNIEELNKLLNDKKLELFSAKMKLKTMQLKNTSELRVIKKDIAKVLTAISQKKAEDK